MTKLISKLAPLGLGLGLLSAVAGAQEVHLTGGTLGRFNAGAYTASTSLLGLSYSNSTFDNDTVGGLLDLGGNPSPGSNFNNLGSFSLDAVDHIYNGNTFQVQATFTSPFTIAGGSTTTFNDVITGTVSSGNGGVFIDFDNTPQTFTYSNGTQMGTFTMAVNDLSIAPGQNASVTAHITGSSQPVPEPVSMAGIVCGVVGLIKRRKSIKAKN